MYVTPPEVTFVDGVALPVSGPPAAFSSACAASIAFWVSAGVEAPLIWLSRAVSSFWLTWSR